jgi:hypothetical protein
MEYDWEYTGHGERPWDEEFHTVRVGKKHEFFVAPDGEHFETILDLLFSYRLRVKHYEDVMEHAELLLKVLRKVPSSHDIMPRHDLRTLRGTKDRIRGLHELAGPGRSR